MWPKYLRSLLRPVNESVIERSLASLGQKDPTPPAKPFRRGDGICVQCAAACDSRHASLLQLDLRASVFELLFDLLCFVLGHVGLDLFGSAFNQIFRFLAAQARNRPDF